MHLKFNIFNTPFFNIKMMETWFDWMIQWLAHKYFITGRISVFEQISWMNDAMTNTFF